jgi:hypothetical protein
LDEKVVDRQIAGFAGQRRHRPRGDKLLGFGSRPHRDSVTDQRADGKCDREPTKERGGNERCPVHVLIIGSSHAGC